MVRPTPTSTASNSSSTTKDDDTVDPSNNSVGFWHPELRPVRRKVFTKWVLMTLFLGTMIISLLSIYWGALKHVEKNFPSLTVAVVDFDGKIAPYNSAVTPVIGPLITKAAQKINAKKNTQSSPHLGFIVKEPEEFGGDPMEVRRMIYREEHWAAVIVNPNATSMLMDTVQNGNASYDPAGAAQIIYVQARQESTLGTYVLPHLSQFQKQVQHEFSLSWVPEVVANLTSSNIRNNIADCPQALSPAFDFSTFNLRPFTPALATPAVTVGLIYLIIFSFFSFSFYMPIHSHFVTPTPSPHRPLTFSQWIIWRILANLSAYLFFSLCYSLVSLAFRVPFSRSPGSEIEMSYASAYGRGSFVVYWMVNFVGTTALGFPCENMGMFLGFPWFALWLVFWVISNICTAIYSIPLAPGLFKYGYAWPIHNIVQASRTIIFDTHSRIGLNFGVLFAWSAISIALYPFAAYFARWKMLREKAREAKESEKRRQAEEQKEDVEKSAEEFATGGRE